MGRVKSSIVKGIATKVYDDNKEMFSDDFTKNKVIVNQHLRMASKRLRNIVVGYVTTLNKRNKHQGQVADEKQ